MSKIKLGGCSQQSGKKVQSKNCGIDDYDYDYVLGERHIRIAMQPSLSQSCFLEEPERAVAMFKHSQDSMLQSHEGIDNYVNVPHCQ